MPRASMLTGQDIAEAHYALTALLERSLTRAGSDRLEYVVLRLLVGHGPFSSPGELHDFLISQHELGLTADGVARLLSRIEKRGLASRTGLQHQGPAQATPSGAMMVSQLVEAMIPTTRELFAGIDPGDQAAAHRVLNLITERAARSMQGSSAGRLTSKKRASRRRREGSDAARLEMPRIN